MLCTTGFSQKEKNSIKQAGSSELNRQRMFVIDNAIKFQPVSGQKQDSSPLEKINNGDLICFSLFNDCAPDFVISNRYFPSKE